MIKKIINDESSVDDQSKSPPSPTQGPNSRVVNFGQNGNERM